MRRPVRGGAALLLAVAALGVVALAVASALHSHTLAFTLGVQAPRQVVSLTRDVPACQAPIEVPAPFEAIRFKAGSNDRVGSPLEVTVRGRDGRTLASARVPKGYNEDRPIVARVGRVPAGDPVSVCIEASGETRVELYGDLGGTLPASGLRFGAEPRDADLSLVFLRDRPVSAASLVPAMLERATLFGPDWLDPAALAVLLVLAAVGAPLFLALALVRAGGRAPSEEARAAAVRGE